MKEDPMWFSSWGQKFKYMLIIYILSEVSFNTYYLCKSLEPSRLVNAIQKKYNLSHKYELHISILNVLIST